MEEEAAPEGKPEEEIKENQQPDGMFTQCLCTTQTRAVDFWFIVEKCKSFSESCYLVVVIRITTIAFTKHILLCSFHCLV